MCIISFHIQDHPKYKLILIANRDEAYERPTAPLHFWDDEPHILAGRDLKAKGTWLGITKQGKIAALTNYRDPKQIATEKQSRGDIIRNYLSNQQAAIPFLHELQNNRHHFNGFNLLLGTVDQLFFIIVRTIIPNAYQVVPIL